MKKIKIDPVEQLKLLRINQIQTQRNTDALIKQGAPRFQIEFNQRVVASRGKQIADLEEKLNFG